MTQRQIQETIPAATEEQADMIEIMGRAMEVWAGYLPHEDQDFWLKQVQIMHRPGKPGIMIFVSPPGEPMSQIQKQMITSISDFLDAHFVLHVTRATIASPGGNTRYLILEYPPEYLPE
jgi:hypothetical protein